MFMCHVILDLFFTDSWVIALVIFQRYLLLWLLRTICIGESLKAIPPPVTKASLLLRRMPTPRVEGIGLRLLILRQLV